MEHQSFGGVWTEKKISIFIKYVKAYLTIMNKFPELKIIYFDGFAGSGYIALDKNSQLIESIGVQVAKITEPKTFDFYYYVDNSSNNIEKLKYVLKDLTEKSYVVEADCNMKIRDMASFMKRNLNYRALALIDPFGMQLNWDSVVQCKDLGIDLWILVPTGIGINRLLKKDGTISESSYNKLEKFLGLNKVEIENYFYTEYTDSTLFGDEVGKNKKNQIIDKIVEIYVSQLNKVWKLVSKPFSMKNSKGATLYHFILATNNKAGLSIGNDIIGKELMQ